MIRDCSIDVSKGKRATPARMAFYVGHKVRLTYKPYKFAPSASNAVIDGILEAEEGYHAVIRGGQVKRYSHVDYRIAGAIETRFVFWNELDLVLKVDLLD